MWNYRQSEHFAFKAGSGPRHLVFHPNGKIAHVMTEFVSEVIVYITSGK
ncbi:beta-propeller fold lactonase family protein [Bacillus sp. X1(2014)]